MTLNMPDELVPPVFSPRFRPGQKVWFLYADKIKEGKVIEVTSGVYSSAYTVLFISPISQEDSVTYTDTQRHKCALFATEQECIDFHTN